MSIKIIILCMTMFPIFIFGKGGKITALPTPQYDKPGKPIMALLGLRSSTYTYASKELSEQDLSNLLWAAWGVNRPESGKRTAPSAVNVQEVSLYVATKGGVFLYQAVPHALELVNPLDIRSLTGPEKFVTASPVNLIFVVDYDKMKKIPTVDQQRYAAADCGFISQNVYLFCASESMGTVVRAVLQRAKIEKELRLSPNQAVIFAQSVGYLEN